GPRTRRPSASLAGRRGTRAGARGSPPATPRPQSPIRPRCVRVSVRPVVPTSARYAAMRWNTPLSEAHAESLIEQLDVSSARSVLDLGCGWGELLLRVVEVAADGCRGVGVDAEEELLGRGRRAARERGLAEHVEFVCRRAQDWDQPADRVLCIGSSHALDGTASALAALRALVAPGGRLLFGDGCWEGETTPEADAIFGDDVLALDRVLEHARDAG